MLFSNKELINISGMARRTYYRRINELKQTDEFTKLSKGAFLNLEEAKIIASKLGFTFRFDKYVLEQQKK